MPQTPKIKLKNIQELAKIAKEVIPVVQPYIVKYAPKIAEEAQKRASNCCVPIGCLRRRCATWAAGPRTRCADAPNYSVR